MDFLLAQGWRHFGVYFFRYQQAWHRGRYCTVMPLRIELSRFLLSRSQKRVLAKNSNIKTLIRATTIDKEKEELFYRHRQRFKQNIPDSIYTFLSEKPATVPCPNQEICVYIDNKLVAASFLDVGEQSTSAVYAMFEPMESKRSLGIFTMLLAIQYSQAQGCHYYYPGYAYHEPSFYDYKKNFSGLEYLNWQQGWQPFPSEVDSQSQEETAT
ncbi:MAG: arginine-tRNA-protein transferase [Acidobacteriota bacterium]